MKIYQITIPQADTERTVFTDSRSQARELVFENNGAALRQFEATPSRSGILAILAEFSGGEVLAGPASDKPEPGANNPYRNPPSDADEADPENGSTDVDGEDEGSEEEADEGMPF